MHKNKKYLRIISMTMVASCGLFLSGCASDLEGHSVKISQTSNQPININTYTNDGQKIDSIKTSQIKIKDDNKLDPAIDITYGENKIIHTGSSLIAYQGLTNYMDAYRHLQAKTNTQDVLRDKSLPVAGTIYQNFKGSLQNIEHRNLILVKSQTGTPIGAFVGSDIHVKEIGGTDFSNSIITIDDHKLFVYDCSYTIYPTSALKATGQNTKAPRTQKQDSVKTSSNTGEVPPTDSAKPVKHKNK